MTRGAVRLLVTVAAAAGGLILFAVAVRAAGVSEIAAGIARIGWGLLPILGLAGARFVLRTQAWRLCMPPAARLPFPPAFTAFLGGDAIGNLTPLGMLASEPTKILLTRHRQDTRESVSSLAIDNLVYAASALTFVAIGAVLLLVTVPLPFEWREGAAALLVAVLAASIVAMRLLRGTWSAARGQRPPWRERLATLRQSVLAFSAANPSQLARVYALHLVFHVLAILEVYLALQWLLGASSPGLTQVVILTALDRVVMIVFKFVPYRVGVDEWTSGAMTSLLGLGTAVGVTLALVRKLRHLFWTGVGLALIGVHRARSARATDRP